MIVKIDRKENSTLIKVIGRLDTLTSQEFDSQISQIDVKAGDIVIDCGDMEYISSAGLRSFISLLKKVKAAGRTMEVTNLTSAVRPIFDMTGFSSLFNLK